MGKPTQPARLHEEWWAAIIVIPAGATGLGSASSNAFAAAAGGGADVTLTRHVSLRAIQVDYFYTHFGGTGQNNPERVGVALRQVIKSEAAVTILFLDG